MKYRYGNSWEKFPVDPGQIWIEQKTKSMVSVCDVIQQLPDYMTSADMIYCDPPWNLGQVNGYITKVGGSEYFNYFWQFYGMLFSRIYKIAPNVCYVEIGKQHLNDFQNYMGYLFDIVQTWQTTYCNNNPCYLIRGGRTRQSFDFTGHDESQTPGIVVEIEPCSVVGDLCTGQGLTAVAAWSARKKFVGTELNKRRLAVAIERVNKLGGQYECSVS